MVSQSFVVAEPLGLHLRPAGKLCEVSLKYQSRIQMKKGDYMANAKSVLGLLAARVQYGDEIEIICDGADEEEALLAVTEFMQESLGNQ